MRIKLQGIIPALLTPFTKGGAEVDYDKACALATRLADQGVQGVFVAGTTGEGFLMTVAERKKLLEEVVAAVGKRIRVVAQTGFFDTPTTIELTRHARAAGAAAAGVITPGFYTYDDASIARHFKMVAGAVKGFPVLLYNLPGCAKNALSADLVLELAKVENIVGVKDSTGNMPGLSVLLAERSKGFHVINGCDEFSYQAYVSGADGTVSSTANVYPELFLDIFKNVKKGNLKRAWASQVKLGRACALFQYGRMVAYYKEGLRLRGFEPGAVRPPQRELTAREKKAFAKGLEAAGLI
jgi:dihydrodipicolinate synthase/N-acetylneuraminate lyase